MHFMDEYIIEICDPDSGTQLPPGEVGEIVATPLANPIWGLIRYGTGDLSSYVTEPCPCGRTTYRISGIVGRTADAVKVRGMFVIAKQAEGVLSEFEDIAQFQLIVGRSGERDELVLKVELADKSVDEAQLSDLLIERFPQVCRVRPDRIECVNRGTIPEDRQTIVDERKWD
jgi:phenylacetate-CoA ligase